MNSQQIDAFLEYLHTVDENANSLTNIQAQKLELIHSKIGEIVKKVESVQTSQVKTQVREPLMIENSVIRYSEYQALNEMIKKRGRKWIVTDKSGKKVLGTHPSREKALKQLRAIEISKMGR